MRAALMRMLMLAAGWVIAILVVPGVLLGLWFITRPRDRLQGILESLQGGRGIVLIIAVGVLEACVALLIARAIARRQASRLTTPITALAEQAERLGAGESRIARLDSGIPEIDQIGEVLVHSSADLTRQLAQQRDFAADASHQLRTPLTALLMRLDEIAATQDLDAAHEEAGIAIDQVVRLAAVVDELLARSRRADSELSAVSLDTVLAGLQREWQPVFARSRRSIRIHGERGLQVRASSSAVAQIVSTLFENALQHGGGTVDVQARRSGRSVVLEVSDDGDGIGQDLAPRIFERSVSSSGSGLGLTLARDLAAANEGRLELLSAQPPVFALFLSEAEPSVVTAQGR